MADEATEKMVNAVVALVRAHCDYHSSWETDNLPVHTLWHKIDAAFSHLGVAADRVPTKKAKELALFRLLAERALLVEGGIEAIHNKT